eukprot:GHUV01019923.1.p2 GENE.GHUV01019923.1~~GHUV01019923.1.p2  ORF type:complete len:158 (+),score=31.96 GHUV01019923.1:489-962(+)
MSDGSLAGYDSVEKILEAYIPAEQLSHVKRVLYGTNQGNPLAALDLPKSVQAAAAAGDYDLQAYRFTAAAEHFRTPRIVRIGLIQNAIVTPTTASMAEQRQAIYDRVTDLIDAAGQAGVKIVCMQEAWVWPASTTWSSSVPYWSGMMHMGRPSGTQQ